jgi:hypothetical protein
MTFAARRAEFNTGRAARANTAVAATRAMRCRLLSSINARLHKQAQQLRSQPIAAPSGNGMKY